MPHEDRIIQKLDSVFRAFAANHTQTMSGTDSFVRTKSPNARGGLSAGQNSDWLTVVEAQVKSMRFGSVTITVHEGRVTKVEASICVRFDKS